METNQFKADTKRHLSNLNELRDWLSTLYYSVHFTTITTQPMISMMIVGVEYIRDNITIIRDKLLAAAERRESGE